MPRSDDFAGRVNYAAAVISNGRATSRAFDSCFENHDGDEVATVLVRRAENNPRLAANIWRYLGKETVMAAVERLKDVSTRDMPKVAAETRARCRAEFDAMMARRQAEQDAETQACKDAGYTVEPSPEPHRWTLKRPDGSTVATDFVWQDNAWAVAWRELERNAESVAA